MASEILVISKSYQFFNILTELTMNYLTKYLIINNPR